MRQSKKGIISRRDFLRGGIASAAAAGATALGSTARGALPEPLADALAPSAAYAQEAFFQGEQEFSFDVVGIDEVGIHVVDLTRRNDKGEPADVPNVIVILASTDNPSLPHIQKRADSTGKCVMSIRPYCKENEDGNPAEGIYQANVSITIICDDGTMCDFANPSMLVAGATGYRFGLEPYVGKPYLLGVAFNKQDILHDVKTFLRSPRNQYPYEICVRIKGVTTGMPVTLTFYLKSDTKREKPLGKSPLTLDARFVEKHSYAEAIFSGKFLHAGNEECLPAGEITIVVTAKDTLISELTMKVINAPADAFDYTGPLNTLSCLAGMPFDFSFQLDDSKEKFGWFRNMDVSLLSPALPFHYYFTPYYLVCGFTLDIKLYKYDLPTNTPEPSVPDDIGPIGPDDELTANALAASDDAGVSDGSKGKLLPWGYPIPHYLDNWENALKGDVAKIKNMIKNPQKPFLETKADPPNACRYNRFGSINVDVVLQGLFQHVWKGLENNDYENKQFKQTGSVTLSISADGSYTWQFMAGPFPMFVTLSLTLMTGIGYSHESTHETIRLSDGTTTIDTDHAIDVTSDAFVLNFSIIFRASVGLGISGVFSLSIIATVAFNPSLIFYEEGWREKPFPHKYLPLTLRLDVLLQVLFFKFSLSILDFKTTYDNWKNSNEIEELKGIDAWQGTTPRFALTHPNENGKRYTAIMTEDGYLVAGDGGDLFANMVPVDQGMMGHSLEAKGTLRSGALTEEYVAAAHMDKLPCLVVREDGSCAVELVDAPGYHTFDFDEATLAGQAADEAALAGQAAGEASEGEVAVQAEDAAQAAGGASEGEATGQAEALAQAEGDAAAQGALVAQVEGEPAQQADPAAQAEGEPAQQADLAAQAEPATASSLLTVAALNEGLQDAGSDEHFGTFLGLGRSVAGEYEYDFTPYRKTTGNPCGTAGVLGIEPNGGIKPTMDVPIFEGVYSDARARVVEIAGTMYLFRISTIEYGPNDAEPRRRGRLTASKFNGTTWEVPIVLEYATGDPDHKRVDLCDYDFDIVTRLSGNPWAYRAEACVVLISGKMGGNFYDSASNQMLNVLLLDKNLRVVQRAVKPATAFFEADKSHTLMCPRIADGFGAGATSGALGIAFIVRSAPQATGLMNAEQAIARLVVAQCFAVGTKLSLAFRTTLDDGSYLTLDPSATDLVLSASGDTSGGWMRIVARGTSCYEAWSAYQASKVAFSGCRIMRNIAPITEVMPNIQPWNTHGTFLFTRDRSDTSAENNQNDYYLYEGSFALDATQGSLSAERVDRDAIKGASFAVSPNGSWLFYFDSYTGDPELAKASELTGINASVQGADNPDLGSDKYCMMASRLVNDRFCQDFPFCNVDHPVDNFAVSGTNYGNATIFTTLEITDADKSIGTMRYLAVPHVAAAEVKAFAPIDEFVIAGKIANFQVDVINQGNVIITGFTVTMHDKETGTDLSCDVAAIDPANIMINASDHSWAEGTKLGPASTDEGELVAQASSLRLSEEAENGWFMPGKLMTYRVKYRIPLEWHDKRTVTIGISNYRYVNVQAVRQALSADRIIPHFAVGSGDGTEFDVKGDEAFGTSNLYLPATYYPEGSRTPSGQNPSGQNKTPTPTAGKQVLPNTGDVSSAAGPIALAIGGFGALMSAYSARRAQVEREEREKLNGRTESDE